MICKYCKREIDDDSIFCRFCGEKAVREKRKKKSDQNIKVPAPKLQPSGNYFIWLAKEKHGITQPTAALCTAEAIAYRAGFLEQEKAAGNKITLKAACEAYIESRSSTCSQSTLNGYDTIVRCRFQNYMQQDIHSINWQDMINDEAASDLSGKTIMNSWGFVASALRAAGINPETPTLPQVIEKDLPWLSYDQIEKFLTAMRDKPGEFGALLALHSLRRSELLAVSPSKITWNEQLKRYEIHVEGERIRGRQNKVIQQETNKNSSSRRVVPVMIPRLEELIRNSGCPADEPYVKGNINKLYLHVNNVCRKNGLPEVGCHGLRRSFASLCQHLGIDELQTMQFGGWDDYKAMHKFYVKLDTKDSEKAVKKITRFYKMQKSK